MAGVTESEVRRGPWTIEEDTLLTHYIACHGEGHWNLLAKYAGLKRTGKSCRLRWLNYLKPDIKRGNLTPQEQLLILELHTKWGNRWSKIAQQLPGRTDNEIKNYWRTRVQKQARHLNIESNSKKFFDAVRYLWMPRLLHKMDQSANFSSPSATPLQSSPSDHGPQIQTSKMKTSAHQTSSSQEFGNSALPRNYDYQVEAFSYGETEVKQESFSLFGACGINNAEFESHVADDDWFLEDSLGGNLWNLDNML